MPSVTLAVDHAGRPVIDLYVGLSAATRETLYPSGSFPPPRRVRALVDTGASHTVVSGHRLNALGLDPVGQIKVHSATTEGELVEVPVYSVCLSLAGDKTGVLADPLEVVAAGDLSGLGVQALLGRDVLSRCLLFYHGPGRTITLTFPPFEEP